MLSEPFHRLIVKDEEEMVDLSSMPPTLSERGTLGRGVYHDNTSQAPSHMPHPRKSANVNMVTEEDEEVAPWWYVFYFAIYPSPLPFTISLLVF
jgi:hypothetical protein